jgi:phage FluMu protein Com
MKNVSCHFCNAVFQSVRLDAVRCDSCRQKYLQEYRRKEETKLRRRKSNRGIRERLFAGYGGKCVCCGENKFEFLALDHVNGGGREERKTRSTQQIALTAIREGFPDTYRVLCHNCNQAIGWYGGCPHEKERTA